MVSIFWSGELRVRPFFAPSIRPASASASMPGKAAARSKFRMPFTQASSRVICACSVRTVGTGSCRVAQLRLPVWYRLTRDWQMSDISSGLSRVISGNLAR